MICGLGVRPGILAAVCSICIFRCSMRQTAPQPCRSSMSPEPREVSNEGVADARLIEAWTRESSSPEIFEVWVIEFWIFGRWHSGDPLPILTADANAVMQPLHERMPVILGPDTCATWLNAESDPALFQARFAPCAVRPLRYIQ